MNLIDTYKNNQEKTSQTDVLVNIDSKHFIDDEVFQKVLAICEQIYQSTEINVSPRKIVNLLLKKADFEALRDQLIQQYL